MVGSCWVNSRGSLLPDLFFCYRTFFWYWTFFCYQTFLLLDFFFLPPNFFANRLFWVDNFENNVLDEDKRYLLFRPAPIPFIRAWHRSHHRHRKALPAPLQVYNALQCTSASKFTTSVYQKDKRYHKVNLKLCKSVCILLKRDHSVEQRQCVRCSCVSESKSSEYLQKETAECNEYDAVQVKWVSPSISTSFSLRLGVDFTAAEKRIPTRPKHPLLSIFTLLFILYTYSDTAYTACALSLKVYNSVS